MNNGIFLLSATGAYLVPAHPDERSRATVALIDGVGLSLTFDEVGLWRCSSRSSRQPMGGDSRS